MDISREEIKKMFDVALLRPTTTAADVECFAKAAQEERLCQVCVNTVHIARAAAALKGTSIKVVAPIGFPMGITKTEVKVFEAEYAVREGAAELDMVLNLGAFFDGDFKATAADIRAIVRVASGRLVKVIIETPLLNQEQKVSASRLAQEAGASFVKTCTGFSPEPLALYEDVRLIRQVVGPTMGVKASGRVGNYFRFLAMLEAGANRIGLSLEQAREILKGWDDQHRNSHSRQ
jgi:deoxyribose-phosphate aldolase